MHNYKLKTHRLNTIYNQPHFFILNRGLNSGKPLEHPCPNCFVCLCNNEEEKNSLYWILFGLWQGKSFHPYLVGSVILLIRIDDVKLLMNQALKKCNLSPHKFLKNIYAIRQIHEHALNIQKQLDTIKQLKQAIMLDILK